MDWVDYAVWWQVYPLGFAGAPIRGPHDGVSHHAFDKLERWLDYAIELGASGLLLGPIFESSTHGYDTVDYYRVDSRLGSEDDFDRFVAAAKQRGLRVLLDGVFNHVGKEYPALQQTLHNGPDAPEARLFRMDWAGWQPGRAPKLGDFEGHGDLVALNHEDQAVADLVGDVMRHWLRRGIDGWRLDAAYSMNPDFWARVLPGVRAEFDQAWFCGEMIHGDYADVVARSGMDSVTQYELWKAIWSSLQDRNLFELEWALRRHNEYVSAFGPLTFIGNHDVTRIATKIGPEHAVLALAVLCTVGGVPSIYYGDEQGWTGTKYDDWGGDDQIRPPFPDSPDHLSKSGEWMYRIHQGLISLRRRHPWLVAAQVEKVELSNTRFAYRARGPEESLLVELDAERPAVVIRDPRKELFRYPR